MSFTTCSFCLKSISEENIKEAKRTLLQKGFSRPTQQQLHTGQERAASESALGGGRDPPCPVPRRREEAARGLGTAFGDGVVTGDLEICFGRAAEVTVRLKLV